MNQQTALQNPRHRPDPFDPSARTRLQRAGLLTGDGVPNELAIITLANSYAGLFYDELCDNCAAYESVLAIKNQLLIAQHNNTPPRSLFLHLCFHYDSICKPLPDPMWWMAGNDGAIACFVQAYIERFKMCCKDEEGDNP